MIKRKPIPLSIILFVAILIVCLESVISLPSDHHKIQEILKQELSPKELQELEYTRSLSNPNEGTVATFHILVDSEPNLPIINELSQLWNFVVKTEFKLREVANNAYFWVDTSSWSNYITATNLKTLKEEFDNNIYPNNTTYFGQPRDTDSDKPYILLADLEDPEIGHYNPFECSANGHDIIVVDATNGITSDTFYATIAHELQHLTHANYDGGIIGGEETWVNEGLSMFAEFINYGYYFDLKQFAVKPFLNNPDNNLTSWGGSSGDYGQTFLFFEYLTQLAAENGANISTLTKDIVKDEKNGIESLNTILPNYLPNESDTFKKSFKHGSLQIVLTIQV